MENGIKNRFFSASMLSSALACTVLVLGNQPRFRVLVVIVFTVCKNDPIANLRSESLPLLCLSALLVYCLPLLLQGR
jgi:hypothetical protein